MTLGQNGVLRYMAIIMIFWSTFEDRMANLGLIDFKIGLYIKVFFSFFFSYTQNRWKGVTLAKLNRAPLRKATVRL